MEITEQALRDEASRYASAMTDGTEEERRSSEIDFYFGGLYVAKRIYGEDFGKREAEISSTPLTDAILELNGFERAGGTYGFYKYNADGVLLTFSPLVCLDIKAGGGYSATMFKWRHDVRTIGELCAIVRAVGLDDEANSFKVK